MAPVPPPPPRLSEEREEVEREWNRLPKKEELEQHLRDLTRQTEELRDEVTQVGVAPGHCLRPF